MSMKKKSAKEVKKIWQTEMKVAMEQVVAAALTGKQFDNEIVEVELTLPKPLVQAIKRAAKQTGLSEKELFGEIAVSMFQESIVPNEQQEETVQQKPLNPMPQAIDFSGLQQQFGQIQNLMGQLKDLEGLMNADTSGITKA